MSLDEIKTSMNKKVPITIAHVSTSSIHLSLPEARQSSRYKTRQLDQRPDKMAFTAFILCNPNHVYITASSCICYSPCLANINNDNRTSSNLPSTKSHHRRHKTATTTFYPQPNSPQNQSPPPPSSVPHYPPQSPFPITRTTPSTLPPPAARQRNKQDVPIHLHPLHLRARHAHLGRRHRALPHAPPPLSTRPLALRWPRVSFVRWDVRGRQRLVVR